MIYLRTIKENIINEIIIKNSRFITLLFKINNNLTIDKIIAEVKKNYPKANHYCFAYITGSYKKSSDDGEPGGTAGMPMLNVLEKEGLTNILAITVRYFGGIKLGAGGLVRAYSKSVKDAIVKANLIEVCKGYLVLIKTNYQEQKNLDYILKEFQVISKKYLEDVTYNILIPKDKIDIISNYSYQILEEEYIEKLSL